MDSQAVDSYGREEPDATRFDRNYAELLQELRVVQTGVQILFAFLLATAFQQRFGSVDLFEQILFLFALFFSACSSILLTAPAAVHRMLFRRRVKDEIVDITALLVKAGMTCLAVAMLTAITFVTSFVMGLAVALALCGALGVLIVTTWLVLPKRRWHRRTRSIK